LPPPSGLVQRQGRVRPRLRWDAADAARLNPWGLPAQKKWFTEATPFAGVAQSDPAKMPEPMSLERFLTEKGGR